VTTGTATLLAITSALAALSSVACADADAPTPAAPYVPAPSHPVTFSATPEAPRVLTDRVDAMGRPVTVGCATCHSLADLGHPERRSGEPLEAFHQGLEVAHGDLSCQACHAAPDYATLRLADGRTVPFTDVQRLCAQCHGPQARDFALGLHGGMSGYWDRSQGPQERHHCTVCHDAHSPAFVGMHPAPPPVEPRFGRGVR